MRARTAALAAGLVVVATAAGVGVYLGTARSHHAPVALPVAPVTMPAPVVRPVVKPLPKPKPKSTVPHQAVAAAAPTAFEIKGPLFDVKATVCQMDYVRPLDPPGEQEHTVCWVRQDFGVAPGSNSHGTSYILGHSWSQNELEVLNPVSKYVSRVVDLNKPVMQSNVPTYLTNKLNGYVVTLHTPNGVLNYKVTRAFLVPKEQAGYVSSIMAATTPNRVTLITCAVKDGQDLDYNVIVDAYLSSSIASKS